MQTAEKEPGQAEIFKSGDRLLEFDLSEELNHGIAVSNLAYAVAAELGQDEEFCYQMAIAGMLHDIGKLKLTGYINGQENDPLLIEELKYVRMHSSLGYEELIRGIQIWYFRVFCIIMKIMMAAAIRRISEGTAFRLGPEFCVSAMFMRH